MPILSPEHRPNGRLLAHASGPMNGLMHSGPTAVGVRGLIMINNRGTSRIVIQMHREPGRKGGAMNGEPVTRVGALGFSPHAHGTAGRQNHD